MKKSLFYLTLVFFTAQSACREPNRKVEQSDVKPIPGLFSFVDSLFLIHYKEPERLISDRIQNYPSLVEEHILNLDLVLDKKGITDVSRLNAIFSMHTSPSEEVNLPGCLFSQHAIIYYKAGEAHAIRINLECKRFDASDPLFIKFSQLRDAAYIDLTSYFKELGLY